MTQARSDSKLRSTFMSIVHGKKDPVMSRITEICNDQNRESWLSQCGTLSGFIRDGGIDILLHRVLPLVGSYTLVKNLGLVNRHFYEIAFKYFRGAYFGACISEFWRTLCDTCIETPPYFYGRFELAGVPESDYDCTWSDFLMRESHVIKSCLDDSISTTVSRVERPIHPILNEKVRVFAEITPYIMPGDDRVFLIFLRCGFVHKNPLSVVPVVIDIVSGIVCRVRINRFKLTERNGSGWFSFSPVGSRNQTMSINFTDMGHIGNIYSENADLSHLFTITGNVKKTAR